MANPWAGYAAANDDIRHTYERVFYGRQLTGDAMQADAAGMAGAPDNTPAAASGAAGEAPAANPMASMYGTEELTHEERQAGADAYAHAANAPGIRREIEESGPGGRPYQSADAPDLVARGADSREALYGPQMAEGAETKPKATTADLYGPETGKEAPQGGVWGKGQGEGAQPAEDRSAALYGPETGKEAEAGNVWGAAEGAAPGPTAEPSAATPAASGNDMTPG